MKRPRLAKFAGIGSVSQSALANILSKVEDADADADADAGAAPSGSTDGIRKAIHHDVVAATSGDTPHGPLFQSVMLVKKTGGDFEWVIPHPLGMLSWLCQLSKPFSRYLNNALVRHPNSPATPWSIVWYEDEASAGQLLRCDVSRKVHALYWSFEEFGEALNSEYAWCVGGILKSSNSQAVHGGLSAAFKGHMLLFFGEVDNAATHGARVRTYEGSTVLIFARMGCNIADLDSVRGAWGVKGVGGLKP